MECIVRDEHERDHNRIREVNLAAFGQDAEGRLVDELRAGGYVRVSLVAESAGLIVGHILFSELHIATGNGPVSALALAPMAVIPAHQRRGIGSALVRRGLERCRESGHCIVLVLGHVDYYPRFGFSAALASTLDSPYSGESFMAAELQPGALSGISGRVVYPPPFGGF